MTQSRQIKLQLAPKKECQKGHLWLAKIFLIALSVLFLIPAYALALVNVDIIKAYDYDSHILVNELVNLTNVLPGLSREDAKKELLMLKDYTVKLSIKATYISKNFNSSFQETNNDFIKITEDINENLLKQKELQFKINQINVYIAGINSQIELGENQINNFNQEIKRNKENPPWQLILSDNYDDSMLLTEGPIAGVRRSLEEQKMELSKKQEELRDKNQNINQLNTNIKKLEASRIRLSENQKALAQGVVLASDIVKVCEELKIQLETINGRVDSVDIAVSKVNDPKKRSEAIVKYIDNIKERSKELARLSENLINIGDKWTELRRV